MLGRERHEDSSFFTMKVINKISEIAAYIDSGQAGKVTKWLSDDVTIEFEEGSPSPGCLVGIEAVSEFFKNRESNYTLKTRHVISNVRVTLNSEDNYRAQYIMTVYRGREKSNEIDSCYVTDVIDVYKFTDGNEVFLRSRKIKPVFSKSDF